MNISKTNQHEYTQKHAHIHMTKQIINHINDVKNQDFQYKRKKKYYRIQEVN